MYRFLFTDSTVVTIKTATIKTATIKTAMIKTVMIKTLIVCTLVVGGGGPVAARAVPYLFPGAELELAQVSAKEYSIRGYLKAERGDHPGAIVDFSRSLELDPVNADVYYNRGVSYSALGRAAEAIADFSRSIALAPGNADVYYNRGLVLATTGQQTRAIADFNQAIGLYEIRAMTQLLVGDSPILGIHPSLTYLYYHRGLARYGQGDRGAAFQDFQQASNLALATNNQEFHEYLSTVLSQLR